MKTIIYRGYSNKVGWVRGTAYLHFTDRPFNADIFDATKRDFIFVQRFGERAGFVAVDPKSVGMATGAYDNYGNMIFEGDIVEVKGRRLEVVTFSNDFYLLDPKINMTYSDSPLSQTPSRDMKIVDNNYKLHYLKDK